MRMTESLPMFPLNSGLLPGAMLPVRVFEKRYVTMIDACLDGSGEFGVVLIKRGSEVGGGDERYDVGTVARITGMRTMSDGTTLAIARGRERLRVVKWLADDPYPRAVVQRLEAPDGFAPADGSRQLLEEAFADALELLTELGVEMGSAGTLPADTIAATFHALALVPMEWHDKQRMLEMDDPAGRLVAVVEAIQSSNELTRARLSQP